MWSSNRCGAHRVMSRGCSKQREECVTHPEGRKLAKRRWALSALANRKEEQAKQLEHIHQGRVDAICRVGRRQRRRRSIVAVRRSCLLVADFVQLVDCEAKQLLSDQWRPNVAAPAASELRRTLLDDIGVNLHHIRRTNVLGAILLERRQPSSDAARRHKRQPTSSWSRGRF